MAPLLSSCALRPKALRPPPSQAVRRLNTFRAHASGMESNGSPLEKVKEFAGMAVHSKKNTCIYLTHCMQARTQCSMPCSLLHYACRGVVLGTRYYRP
jgi:hypothetical protein